MSTVDEKILLFIPAYNCEKQIGRVLNQINKEMKEVIYEVLVVNNRSTDHTEEVVLNFLAENSDMRMALLRNDDNYGLGGSHKVAFNYAIKNRFDYVIVLHGDDQANVHDILPVIRSGKHKLFDCSLGARFQEGSQLQGYSTFRTFGNRVYNLLFSLVVRKKIYDLGSGLNMYNVSMLKDGFYEKFPDSLSFNYCMILASHFYKHKIDFFPISWREEDQVSNVKMMKQAVFVLKLLGRYFLEKSELIKSELRETVRIEYTAMVIRRGNYEEK